MKSNTIIPLSPSQLAKVSSLAKKRGISNTEALQLIVDMGVKHLLLVSSIAKNSFLQKKGGCLTPVKNHAKKKSKGKSFQKIDAQP